jgi:hypothetical protein
MFAGQDRGQTREVFFRAWRAHREGQPLEGVEKLIVQVVLRHPEYHALLEHPEPARERDYFPESGQTNPFLHLGMHIAIEEQLSIDQPPGIRALFETRRSQYGSHHDALHDILECLGETLWRAQRDRAPLDGPAYLECIRRRG